MMDNDFRDQEIKRLTERNNLMAHAIRLTYPIMDYFKGYGQHVNATPSIRARREAMEALQAAYPEEII